MEVLNIIFLLFLYIHFGDCFASGVASSQFPIRSDYKYDEQVAGWVKWHEIRTTWHEARLRCYYEGAVLASPINENYQQMMIKMLEKQGETGMFTGIHSKFSNGDYTSIEGVPLREINISTYGKFDQNCTVFHRNNYLVSSDCSNDKCRYMCYKRGLKVLRYTICGTDDEGQDMSQAGYDKWDEGSRDRRFNQFCGSVNRSGKLNDIWCDGEENTFPAICEITPVHHRLVKEEGMTLDELGAGRQTDDDGPMY